MMHGMLLLCACLVVGPAFLEIPPGLSGETVTFGHFGHPSCASRGIAGVGGGYSCAYGHVFVVSNGEGVNNLALTK